MGIENKIAASKIILGLDPGIRGALAEMVTNVLVEADLLMEDQP